MLHLPRLHRSSLSPFGRRRSPLLPHDFPLRALLQSPFVESPQIRLGASHVITSCDTGSNNSFSTFRAVVIYVHPGCLALHQLQSAPRTSCLRSERRQFTLLPHDSLHRVHRRPCQCSSPSESESNRSCLHCSDRRFKASHSLPVGVVPTAARETICYFAHTANAVQQPSQADKNRRSAGPAARRLGGRERPGRVTAAAVRSCHSSVSRGSRRAASRGRHVRRFLQLRVSTLAGWGGVTALSVWRLNAPCPQFATSLPSKLAFVKVSAAILGPCAFPLLVPNTGGSMHKQRSASAIISLRRTFSRRFSGLPLALCSCAQAAASPRLRFVAVRCSLILNSGVMNSRLLALVVVASLLVGAIASYCTYGTWREHRVDEVIEGMTREQVRKIAGSPDRIGSPTAFESSCAPGGA